MLYDLFDLTNQVVLQSLTNMTKNSSIRNLVLSANAHRMEMDDRSESINMLDDKDAKYGINTNDH